MPVRLVPWESRPRLARAARVPSRAPSAATSRRLSHTAAMSIGTAFHPRTSPLNRKMQWREWSGYFASSVYADAHDIEYNAIREAAALIDVSPLFKYRVSGPDATRLVDRVDHPRRDEAVRRVGDLHAVVRRARQGHRRRHGPRLDDGSFRWTAADPQLRWLAPERAAASTSTVEDVSEAVAALALQGPLSRDGPRGGHRGGSFADLRYFRRRAADGSAGVAGRRLADRLHGRPRLRDLGRRGAGASASGTR